MTRRLILLRHGQTEYNATSRMQGQLDTELSDLGFQQAASAASVLVQKHHPCVQLGSFPRLQHRKRGCGAD